MRLAGLLRGASTLFRLFAYVVLAGLADERLGHVFGGLLILGFVCEFIRAVMALATQPHPPVSKRRRFFFHSCELIVNPSPVGVTQRPYFLPFLTGYLPRLVVSGCFEAAHSCPRV
jgi:hypothetical protein